ncbi:MAG: PRC-barrel domain-containing protein [Gemmatimonadaceae bacterium]|nr:PRC-barrel domain-containing protein [Gloeobacterales cyanobacterium ES-bin-141]
MLFVKADDLKSSGAESAGRLEDEKIYDQSGERIGEISDVYVNVDNANERYLRAGVGGFLGFGAKDVLILESRLAAQDGKLYLNMPKAELQAVGRPAGGSTPETVAGILVPPVDYTNDTPEGVKAIPGEGTPLPGGVMAKYDGGGKPSRDLPTVAMKGNRLYERGGEQFGTIEEIYCDPANGNKPVLAKVIYGGDPQPGGFFNLFGKGKDVLVSVDSLSKEGDYYYLQDTQATNQMHDIAK